MSKENPTRADLMNPNYKGPGTDGEGDEGIGSQNDQKSYRNNPGANPPGTGKNN